MPSENPQQPDPQSGSRYGNNWRELFASTKIKDLLNMKKRRLVSISSRATIEETIQLLAVENILSAPVVNEMEGTFLGFVDVLDICGYILYTWKKISPSLERSLFPVVHFTQPVVEIINFSQWNPAIYIDDISSVKDLISLFCSPKFHKRVHRVAVLSNGNVSSVVTQSDVIAYAHLSIDSMGEFADRSISDLNLIRGGVMVARIDDTVTETLEKLYENRISGLALVDHEYRFRGVFSASDLRGFRPTSFEFFNGSTLMFLAKGTNANRFVPSVTCLPTASLRQVIRQMVENRVHRMFITDATDRPVGIVSMGDILQLLSV